MKFVSHIVVAMVVGLTGTSVNAAAHAKAPVSEADGVLVDAKGMSLYTFDKDTGSESTCYDTCAQMWPPFAAPDDADESEKFTVVERKDGTKQWAYEGKPLYFWINDVDPGERTGDGVEGVWRLARP